MLAKILSGTVVGIDGLLIEVEVDIAYGLPTFATVGLPEGAVRESKDRVKSAIKNCGYDFPNRKITVNLAPADVKKTGTGFDLPIALGIMLAGGANTEMKQNRYAAVGELSLDGAVRPAHGILPMTIAARDNGLKGILVPVENVEEAAVVQGIEAIAVKSLPEALEFFNGVRELPAARSATDCANADVHGYELDFADVKGQEHVKRALEIAAAGGHNVMMQGPPGSGKTMLARRISTILPDLSFEESLETTKIYSVMGMMSAQNGLITRRPFRAPHHTISDAGLIGGGQIPRPGEVSLAHNGVLFLDEMPEFRRNVLEVLRQPLEDGYVTIARAAHSLRFPAKFMLVAAMNPCPCGHLGDHVRECTCNLAQIQRYMSRLSGPLLDRIDLHLEVPAVKYQEIVGERTGETSAVIKERVIKARDIQRQRFARLRNCHCNSQMGSKDLHAHCVLDDSSRKLLQDAIERLGLSARAYDRILKMARTIADLDGEESLSPRHVAEAVQYRRLDRKPQN